MLAGLPGTGKTTLAMLLAQHFQWIILDKDRIHTELLSNGVAGSAAGALAYALTLGLAADIITRQYQSAIVDTAGRQPVVLQRCQAIAAQSGCRLVIIQCVAPAVLRATRLSQRTPLPSQWAIDQATDSDQEMWYRHLPANTLRIDTQQPLAVCVAQAMAYLSTAM
jgi:predicted kinase